MSEARIQREKALEWGGFVDVDTVLGVYLALDIMSEGRCITSGCRLFSPCTRLAAMSATICIYRYHTHHV